MQKLLEQLKARYTGLTFRPGEAFMWSPKEQTVYYAPVISSDPYSSMQLLHETGHALLGHTTYHSDTELISLEIAAWQRAKELSKEFAVAISTEHIEQCLDTYRDWVYQRAQCPQCRITGSQQDEKTYSCLNCENQWSVTDQRFCRPYRKLHTVTA